MQIKTFTYKRKRGNRYVLDQMFGPDMDKHIEGMINDGWEMMMNSASDQNRLRVGKTLMMASLTMGTSLLFGASRTKDRITVTFSKP